MKFTVPVLTALATLVINSSALVAPVPRAIGTEVTGHVANGLKGEVSPEVRRSLIAPGDSNAERIQRGLPPKAPMGVFHKKATQTAGAKRQQPSSTGSPSKHANLLAYSSNTREFVGAFWLADDRQHVTLSKTAGFNFDTSTISAASEQGITFGATDTSGVTTTYWLASYVGPKGGSLSNGAYVVFSYASTSDNGNPENFCYTQNNGYETSSWGWGDGLYNTYGSYEWFDPSSTVTPNIYFGADGYVYAANAASDIPSTPPTTEDAKLILYWIQS